MKFPAKIENKKLIFTRIDWVKNYLSQMKDGQLLIINIDKRRKIRSNAQNAMYWGHILPTIADETGHNAEELHFFFKRMFMPRKYIKVGKKRVLADPTTTSLTTKEFMEYVEKILVFSSQELGIEWHLPD